ncbi:hypothetical protein Q9L42_019880 [Methylomarinum sp. Ch1-1]|uniref:Uncharacterized protein n=1 Tax=Methylomarinum roseum TaxID=3067653 RepID=A0AAU7NUA8_9GAMM|nr:hypothetical protein [Methylomarinum sp. Ch1-1]MDP4519344.1 hypothetical protein [Methylomarinum sp. Ch1-1]
MKRIKNGALPIVSTPYRIVGRLREASRQKPPPGQNWPLCVSRRIAWRRILLHANVALPSDVLNSVKRIKNGALPLVSTPYRIVGRLREASRQKPARVAGYLTHPKRLTYFRRICC